MNDTTKHAQYYIFSCESLRSCRIWQHNCFGGMRIASRAVKVERRKANSWPLKWLSSCQALSACEFQFKLLSGCSFFLGGKTHRSNQKHCGEACPQDGHCLLGAACLSNSSMSCSLRQRRTIATRRSGCCGFGAF